jgi:hypothetical protein
MRNYEEFKGVTHRLEFDAASKNFVYVPLASHFLSAAPKSAAPKHEGELIMLPHKKSTRQSQMTRLGKRRVA